MTIIRGCVINDRELWTRRMVVGNWPDWLEERFEDGESVFYDKRTGKKLVLRDAPKEKPMTQTPEQITRLVTAARAYATAVNEHADQDDPAALEPFYDELEAALEPFETIYVSVSGEVLL
jgi:hypothetical protein